MRPQPKISQQMYGRMDGGRHTFGVDSWVVPCFFARVDVNPPSLVLAVDLDPDVVFAVPNPSDASAHGAAEHGKAVGKLTSAASAGFEQSPDISVSGEPFVGAAVAVLTSVQFDSGSASS